MKLLQRIALRLAGKRPARRSHGKNPNAVALGRLGGVQGGRARAAVLSRARRVEIAKRGAAVRWGRESASGKRSSERG